MKYAELPDEIRIVLTREAKAAVRRSAAIETSGQVDDAILLSRTSPLDINKLEGYSIEAPSVWFEFVSKDKSDEEALKMAQEAADSLK